ncbi:MAG: sigma-70 family RNA polymerase sigma factor [Lachnospiraceae bacterium]|nr:sigma-70 family RNA polymerase sigma factor [Lachnospiraceae bacterium]
MDAETIVLTYSDMVYRIAMRYVRQPADAEDVYSEVFLRYFRKLRTFESEEHRKAWLIKVTMNCAKDLLTQKLSYDEIETVQIPEAEKGPDKEELLDLRNAMEGLKPEYREAISLYYLDGLSVKQVADVMDRPENTVKSLLMRGREALKKELLAADKALSGA